MYKDQQILKCVTTDTVYITMHLMKLYSLLKKFISYILKMLPDFMQYFQQCLLLVAKDYGSFYVINQKSNIYRRIPFNRNET